MSQYPPPPASWGLGNVVVRDHLPALPTFRELSKMGRRLQYTGEPVEIVPISNDDGPGPNEIRIVHIGEKGTQRHAVVAHQEVISEIALKIGGFALASNPFGMDVLRNEYLDKYPNEWVTRPHPWVEYEEKDAEWSYPLRYGYFKRNYKRLLVIVLHSGAVRADQVAINPNRPGHVDSLVYWHPNQITITNKPSPSVAGRALGGPAS